MFIARVGKGSPPPPSLPFNKPFHRKKKSNNSLSCVVFSSGRHFPVTVQRTNWKSGHLVDQGEKKKRSPRRQVNSNSIRVRACMEKKAVEIWEMSSLARFPLSLPEAGERGEKLSFFPGPLLLSVSLPAWLPSCMGLGKKKTAFSHTQTRGSRKKRRKKEGKKTLFRLPSFLPPRLSSETFASEIGKERGGGREEGREEACGERGEGTTSLACKRRGGSGGVVRGTGGSIHVAYLAYRRPPPSAARV